MNNNITNTPSQPNLRVRENTEENVNKQSTASGLATPSQPNNIQVMRDITSILKQRKIENMAWNSSREINYNMTDCENTSPSRKSRDRNIIVFDKSNIRDIHIQQSREKILSHCRKDIESSDSRRKDLLCQSMDIDKENMNPLNPYTETLDYFIDFKTPEKGNSICKNLALESFSKYLEI